MSSSRSTPYYLVLLFIAITLSVLLLLIVPCPSPSTSSSTSTSLVPPSHPQQYEHHPSSTTRLSQVRIQESIDAYALYLSSLHIFTHDKTILRWAQAQSLDTTKNVSFSSLENGCFFSPIHPWIYHHQTLTSTTTSTSIIDLNHSTAHSPHFSNLNPNHNPNYKSTSAAVVLAASEWYHPSIASKLHLDADTAHAEMLAIPLEAVRDRADRFSVYPLVTTTPWNGVTRTGTPDPILVLPQDIERLEALTSTKTTTTTTTTFRYFGNKRVFLANKVVILIGDSTLMNIGMYLASCVLFRTDFETVSPNCGFLNVPNRFAIYIYIFSSASDIAKE